MDPQHCIEIIYTEAFYPERLLYQAERVKILNCRAHLLHCRTETYSPLLSALKSQSSRLIVLICTLKGLGHEKEFKFFDKNEHCHFSQRLMWKDIGEITIIEGYSKITVETLINIFSYSNLMQTPTDFCEQAKHIRGSRKFFYISLWQSHRLYWARKLGIKSSSNDPTV